MKFLFDIAHPANVHYFKNLIWKFEKDGHQVIITAKNKHLVYELLDSYGFRYYKLGTSTSSFLGRFVFILSSTLKIIKVLIKEKIDLTISFGTSYCALASYITKIPYFAFDDTEHAKINRKLYLPLACKVFTPSSFNVNIGTKQHRFPAFMELFYLHPDTFIPKPEILKKMNLKSNDKFAIIRFIAWDAFHDKGQMGIKNYNKMRLIKAIEKKMKVFISIEGELPYEYKEYALNIDSKDIHHVLYYANVYIGEGATTASECALLGTPAIYINKLSVGYLEKLSERGLLWFVENNEKMIDNIDRIISTPNLKKTVKDRKDKLINEMINPTDYFYSYFSKLKL